MNNRAINNLPDWQKGWIAGFIDGEGCIGVYKTRHNTYDKMSASIMVNNTHCASLNIICDITQLGTVVPISKANNDKYWKNRKSIWCWKIGSMLDIYTFLTELTKYIFTKRQQAELVLEYCTGKLSNRPKHDPDYYYEQTLRLNKRGLK